MLARVLAVAFALLLAHLYSEEALAQYPARPIRLIVPAAPGGGTDITARSFAPALQDNLGQPVVIENRGGAGGVIGSDVVAKASPDGYTLLLCYVSHATNPTLVDKLPYDTLRDFTPITLVSHEPTVLVTHPSVPAKTLAEFTAWAKPQGDKLSYATDPGSAGFLAAELYKQLAGVRAAVHPVQGQRPGVGGRAGGPRALHVVGDLHHHAARQIRKDERPRDRGREARARPARCAHRPPRPACPISP